jgi:hypothetical protein
MARILPGAAMISGKIRVNIGDNHRHSPFFHAPFMSTSFSFPENFLLICYLFVKILKQIPTKGIQYKLDCANCIQ